MAAALRSLSEHPGSRHYHGGGHHHRPQNPEGDLVDVSSFENMERGQTKAMLPDDALDGEIENTTEMAEILLLRICVELQNDGQEPKPDPLALRQLVSALEDSWTDMKRNAYADPFLAGDQNRTLTRQMPWVAVEKAVQLYMEFCGLRSDYKQRAVLSNTANRARARARLGVVAEKKLNVAVMRKEAIKELKRGEEPAAKFADCYKDLRSKATPKPPPPKEAPPPVVSRDFVQKRVKNVKANLPRALTGEASNHASFALQQTADSDTGGAMFRSSSLQQIPPEGDRLWELGVDSRAAGPSKPAVLPRNAKPGYEMAAEEILYRLDQPAGMPRERARSATNRSGGPGGTVTAAAAAPDDPIASDSSLKPPPPPPPMPNAPLYQEQPIRTLEDFLSKEAQGYIHEGMPPPVHGLKHVSQRLLNRLDASSRTKQAADDPTEPDANIDIAPLLLASVHTSGNWQTRRASMRLEGDGSGSGASAWKKVQKRYLPRNQAHDETSPMDKLLEVASTVIAALKPAVAPPDHFGVAASSLGSGVVLKAASARVTDRIPSTPLVLVPVSTLYREFDPQVEPQVLRDIDAPLFMHEEVQSTLNQIVEVVDVKLGAQTQRELQEGGFLRATKDELDLIAKSDQLNFKIATVTARAIRGCYQLPGGQPVVSPSLAKAVLSALPRRTIASTWNESRSSSSDRSYAHRPPKVVASSTDSVDVAKRAREYQAWKNWWNSTFSTSDYLEFLAERPTDFLGVVYSIYDDAFDQEVDATAEVEDGGLSDLEIIRAAQNAAKLEEKTAYVPGEWNALSVTQGGLGFLPVVDSELLAQAFDSEDEDWDANEAALAAGSRSSSTASGPRSMAADAAAASVTAVTAHGAAFGVVDRWRTKQETRLVDARNAAEENATEGMFTELQQRLQACWASLLTPTSEVLQLSIKYSQHPYSFVGTSLKSAGKRRKPLPTLTGTRSADGSVLTNAACARALTEAVILWEAATSAIIEREAAFADWREFTRAASEPSRFFIKKANASAMLKEEKQRKFHEKKLAAKTTACTSTVDAVLRALQDAVAYDGSPYKAKMKIDMTDVLHWLERERGMKRGGSTPGQPTPGQPEYRAGTPGSLRRGSRPRGAAVAAVLGMSLGQTGRQGSPGSLPAVRSTRFSEKLEGLR